MPQIIKNKVHAMAIVAVAIALLALPGCFGGGSVDDARATQLEAAATTWVAGMEGLTLELSSILNESTAFRSLAAVRGHIRELQAAIEPLGELDDNDASYVESKFGGELKELWSAFSPQAQRVTITGGIPTEISELLRELPEFGPR